MTKFLFNLFASIFLSVVFYLLSFSAFGVQLSIIASIFFSILIIVLMNFIVIGIIALEDFNPKLEKSLKSNLILLLTFNLASYHKTMSRLDSSIFDVGLRKEFLKDIKDINQIKDYDLENKRELEKTFILLSQAYRNRIKNIGVFEIKDYLKVLDSDLKKIQHITMEYGIGISREASYSRLKKINSNLASIVPGALEIA